MFYRSTYYVNVIEQIIQKAEIALRGNKMADIKASEVMGRNMRSVLVAPFICGWLNSSIISNLSKVRLAGGAHL